jgi:tetratricopeptide (TPR) repeat protein
MGLLVRYSLAGAKEGASSHSMHPVVHKWCGQLAESEEQYSIYSIAAGLVASNLGSAREEEFWKKRKRVLSHEVTISKWIRTALSCKEGRVHDALAEPWVLHNLGDLLSEEDRTEAEAMYQRALQGKEKARGPGHTLTLRTVNNLGNLYQDLGRMDEAEAMYRRALQVYEKAIKPENLSTHVPALTTMWSLAFLYDRQHRVEDGRTWYSKALLGYEGVFGIGHPTCQKLRSDLTSLDEEQKEVDPPRAKLPAQRLMKRLLPAPRQKEPNPLPNGTGS